ncbi:MAG: NADH-quinone oxidoreductase subunit NuoN, partial [Gammaproteobacteria bacterium]|nr:NADH-quinone oxidoreductase subunit NuoN [Gammaproteobacteria bacterium]
MTPTLTIASLAPALPEIYLTAAICLVLLVDVFAGVAARRLTPTLTLLVIGIGAALTLQNAQVGQTMTLFSGMYIADPLATLLKLLTMLLVAVALLYSRHFLETRGLLKGEYYVLALTAMLGIFAIISAGSLLTLYIGIELLSLSLYALVAFDRDSGIAAESAMKYFVLGAIASGCLLYGMSLVYGLTGTLLLNEIAASLQGPPSLGLIMGVVFLVVGVAFKFGGVPFHMWVPDVYHGAPTAVTLLVATAPKIASFALAFRLFSEGLGNTADTWIQMLTIVAVLSALLGNVIAIAQTNLKRMLAYSAIGNVGFILFGFVAGTEQGYEAALYYTLVYVLVALGAFGVVLHAGARGFEADEIEHYKGLHARDPLLAVILMALMFSFAGVPPLVGFWAKLQMFQALWESGHVALIVFAAAVSVVGLFYYLRIVKILYFDSPGELPVPERHGGVRLALGLNALA